MRKTALLLSGAVFAGLAFPSGAAGYTYKVIHTFCTKADCADGQAPQSGLVMDGAGNLYGTTSDGGKLGATGHRDGVVYELTPNAAHTRWSFHILHSFCQKANCADGDSSFAPLILDVNGNLYGVTSYGGTNDGGTVFKLSPNGGHWTFSLLYRFCHNSTACPDGEGPFEGLTYVGQTTGQLYDGVSPLYGTTNFGGKYNETSLGGAAYRLTLDQTSGKWDEDVLYSFCSSSSCSPRLPIPSATVTIGPDGTLYTTVDDDGFTGNIVGLEPKENGRYREKTEYTFCAIAGCLDGENPADVMLTPDGAGNLYGTTLNGGANSGGTIFEFNPSTRHLTTLYSFCALANCADGGEPRGSLLRTAAGDMFGTTSRPPSSGNGTVYELDHTGSFHLLYTLCSETNCMDGADPEAGLISDGSGVLYGTASEGGIGNAGTVFMLTP